MKNITKYILIFLSYFIFDIVLATIQILIIGIFKNFNINLQSNILFRNLYLIIGSLIYLIFMIIMYKDDIKNDIKEIKNNWITLLLKYIPIYLIGILFMSLSNILVQNITNMEISDNEQTVRMAIKILPLYMSFSVVIFAPIVEELIFRKTIRNIVKNDYIYLIISGIVFGLIHISGKVDFNGILMSIPYMIMGFDFSYIYYKSKNIFTTIFIHSIHNTILLILQFIGG